jgi:hypothetical protein
MVSELGEMFPVETMTLTGTMQVSSKVTLVGIGRTVTAPILITSSGIQATTIAETTTQEASAEIPTTTGEEGLPVSEGVSPTTIEAVMGLPCSDLEVRTTTGLVTDLVGGS